MTALGRALEDPGDLGEQIGPAARKLTQLGHRCGLLARQLGHAKLIGCAHNFE